MPVVPFPNTPPAIGAVQFDPTIFITLYPEFYGISPAILQNCFDRATLQLDNTITSRVFDANNRESLLNLLTAHITRLNYGTSPQNGPALAPQEIVGRVANANEGSVSVSAEMAAPTNLKDYYMQTPYGAEFWQVTASYRQMFYVPGSSSGEFGQSFGFGFGNMYWPPGMS